MKYAVFVIECILRPYHVSVVCTPRIKEKNSFLLNYLQRLRLSLIQITLLFLHLTEWSIYP